MRIIILAVLSLLILYCNKQTPVTIDNGQWLVLTEQDISAERQHTRHAEIFGKYVDGYNKYILKGIDEVQSTAPNGGGYFIGKDSIPTESPLGYNIEFLGRTLLDAPRTTSYCSGSSFGAFIEGLNFIFENKGKKIDDKQYYALRMQEKDGGRREDHTEFWGEWNADGYGNHFALVQYSGMGTRIKPNQARPGDFLNVSWKSGLGHSVVFLGWYKDKDDKKHVMYWSSQRATNGYSDQIVPLDKIKEAVFIRLTNPERIFTYEPGKTVDTDISGDKIDW